MLATCFLPGFIDQYFMTILNGARMRLTVHVQGQGGCVNLFCLSEHTYQVGAWVRGWVIK